METLIFGKDRTTAKAASDNDLNTLLDVFGVYSNKIVEFKSYMRTIGYTDETEKVTFRK